MEYLIRPARITDIERLVALIRETRPDGEADPNFDALRSPP